MLACILVISFCADLILGDPCYRLHPVRLIGVLIGQVERVLRRIGLSGIGGGAVLMATVVFCTLAVFWALYITLHWLYPPLATVLSIYILYSCIALRDMLKHTTPIKLVLWQADLPAARSCLARIVGRDVTNLDQFAIVRAVVECVSESFVDGFFAPLFWFVVAGVAAMFAGLPILPIAIMAALAYRCVNTLDSMVGYRNQQYMLFGRISARADDILNFVPARLSLLPLLLSSFLLRMSPLSGLRVALRDRLKHASPNSAHTESFVAGALGLKLGGPTVYPHGTAEKPWLGNGTANALPQHIDDVCRLVLVSGMVALVLFVTIMELSVCL